MKQINTINIIGVNVFFFLSLQGTDVGELFDSLMGKYTNPWFNKCITNKSPEPWFSDSKYAYYLCRSFFENYSIEVEGQSDREFKTPRILHQIWLNGGVPEKYADWIASWHHYNPDWTIIMWMDHDLPFLHLINEDLFKKAKNYGEKSDILRLELLNIFGGLYADTDCQCKQPFDKFNRCNSFYISSVGVGVCGIGVNNAVIGAAQGHPLIQKLIYGMKSAAKKRILSERTGPMYVTKIFFKNAEAFQKDVVMYPALYLETGHHGGDSTKSYSIHWFDASWLRPQGLAKRMPYDPTLEIALTPLYFNTKSTHVGLDTCPEVLDAILKNLKDRTIIELGACSFLINETVDLHNLKYTGISPVKFLTIDQRLFYHHHLNRVYWWKNCLQEDIPHAGLLIMGDVLEYLSYNDSLTLLRKMAHSNPEFFIIAHDAYAENKETSLGQQRALNLCKEPFNLPEPDETIIIQNKTYGVWNNENHYNKVVNS